LLAAGALALQWLEFHFVVRTHPGEAWAALLALGFLALGIWVGARLFRRPPAEADMQRHFQVTPPSVHQMVLTLERAGLIRRQPGVPRSIELLVAPRDRENGPPVALRAQPGRRSNRSHHRCDRDRRWHQRRRCDPELAVPLSRTVAPVTIRSPHRLLEEVVVARIAMPIGRTRSRTAADSGERTGDT
jgi:hypothetical protein